jgi:hypothetical protein
VSLALQGATESNHFTHKCDGLPPFGLVEVTDQWFVALTSFSLQFAENLMKLSISPE